MKYKNITYLFILITLASASSFFIGCEAVDNTTGDDPRDSYIGKWQFVEDLKNTEGQNFSVIITKDPDNSSQVILENFVNSGSGVFIYGLVTSGQIVVSEQQMSNGWTIKGSGVIDPKTEKSMAWDYNLLIAVDWEHHKATATLK
jgi:hypothetical protein